jgi:hypothetical protein
VLPRSLVSPGKSPESLRHKAGEFSGVLFLDMSTQEKREIYYIVMFYDKMCLENGNK